MAREDESTAAGTGDETHTESLRRERGEPGGPRDPRDAMKRVPIAPHNAGVLGVGAVPALDDAAMSETAEDDRREAQSREGH